MPHDILEAYHEYVQMLECWMSDDINEAIANEEYAIDYATNANGEYNPWEIYE